MVDSTKVLMTKEEVLKQLAAIDDLILVYSAIDYIRVEQLVAIKTKLEGVLIDIISLENDIWLAKIATKKTA